MTDLVKNIQFRTTDGDAFYLDRILNKTFWTKIPGIVADDLPYNYEFIMSKKYGIPYYYNKETNISQWNVPYTDNSNQTILTGDCDLTPVLQILLSIVNSPTWTIVDNDYYYPKDNCTFEQLQVINENLRKLYFLIHVTKNKFLSIDEFQRKFEKCNSLDGQKCSFDRMHSFIQHLLALSDTSWTVIKDKGKQTRNNSGVIKVDSSEKDKSLQSIALESKIYKTDFLIFLLKEKQKQIIPKFIELPSGQVLELCGLIQKRDNDYLSYYFSDNKGTKVDHNKNTLISISGLDINGSKGDVVTTFYQPSQRSVKSNFSKTSSM